MSTLKIGLLKSAFFISFFSTISTVLAFLVQLILAKKFGAQLQMDAYFTAIGIPATIMKFLGAPLNFAFTPAYKEVEATIDKKKALHFYASVFWIYCLFFLLLATITFIYAQPISRIIIAGASKTTINLTSNLLRVVAFYIFFLGLYFTTQTLHITKQSFFIPFLSNTISTLIIVTYTYLFLPIQGIYAAVYGLALGALAESIINILFLPENIFFLPKFDKKVFIKFLQLFLPLGIGSIIYKSTPVIDRYFASFLSHGDISVLGYGLKFLESIVGFLATGLSVVLLPISSQYTAEKDQEGLAGIFSWGVRATGFLVIPTICYLLFYSHTLIAALFQRGNFTAQATDKVATVLMVYSGALFALSLGGQFTNIFYAKKRHLQVVIINIILIPLYILSLSILSRLYGVYGIALAYTLNTLTTVIVFIFFIRKLITINWTQIGTSYGKFLLAAVGMAIALIIITPIQQVISIPLLFVLIQTTIAGITYVCILYALKTNELLMVINSISTKFHILKK